MPSGGLSRRKQPDDSSAAHQREAGCRAGGQLEGLLEAWSAACGEPEQDAVSGDAS
jgi:hypothetical protein